MQRMALHRGQELETYLDNNATTKPLPEVVAAVASAMGSSFGNPSSPHSRGVEARIAMSRHAEAVSALAGANPTNLYFTSGGTESNNWVFASFRRRKPAPRIAVSAAEHPSVTRPAEIAAQRGWMAVLPLTSNGLLDMEALASALEKGLDLVSVQWASGETGVVQPVEAIASLCKHHGAEFHIDAAQAFGREALRIDGCGADYVSLSAHKVHGPQGIGALWVRDRTMLSAIIEGGGQQGGLRSGTENLPGAAGFAAACSARQEGFHEHVARMRRMRDVFEAVVGNAVPDAEVNGATAPRLCNTSSIRFKGVDGQALMARLDQAGILCSQTSACSSARPAPSPTLLAMGLTERQAWSTVRFSFSVLNSEEDAEAAASKVAVTVAELRRFMEV
ncbi:cysteine desulfurase (plasmid) [Azospirillum sp. TSA2s]|nr:cysteine desulfurase [Azospirillum sp. TSA2s]